MENKSVQELKKDRIALASFVLGLLSIILWEFSIFPLLAFTLGVIGITRTGKEETGRWMAVGGVVLGVLYLLVRLTQLNK